MHCKTGKTHANCIVLRNLLRKSEDGRVVITVLDHNTNKQYNQLANSIPTSLISSYGLILVNSLQASTVAKNMLKPFQIVFNTYKLTYKDYNNVECL